MVCPDDCAVDHLYGIVAAALGEGFKHQIPQPGGRPTAVLPVHRVLDHKRLEERPLIVTQKASDQG